MSLYVIQQRCVAAVDGAAVHYRPSDRPIEIDDAVAAGLGDAVRRYGNQPLPADDASQQAPVEQPPAEEVTVPEPVDETVQQPEGERPRPRRPRGGDG